MFVAVGIETYKNELNLKRKNFGVLFKHSIQQFYFLFPFRRLKKTSENFYEDFLFFPQDFFTF